MSAVAHSVKGSLLAAFRYLLKPLVRLALKNAVSFPEFSRALKQAYVDVASQELRATGKPATVEGIFVIASIETAEVENILHANAGDDVAFDVQDQSPLPRVLQAWHTDANYTGPYGVLRDLEFAHNPNDPAKKRSNLTFTDLAKTYCPSVSPQALLDELVRTGCVQQVGNDVYRAISRSYVSDPLSTDNIRYFARIVHNFCETLEVNLNPVRPDTSPKGLMERSVWNRNGLNAETFKRFDAFFRDRAQMFANEIDDWLTDHQEKEPSEKSIKTGIGFYHYVVNEEDDEAFSKELPN